MAATIYSTPEGIQLPKIDWKNMKREEWIAEDKRYMDEVIKWAKEHSNDPHAGELLSMQYADGQAMYIVIRTKPVRLIHLEIGDAWEHPYADLLTTARVIEMINQRKAIDKIFKNKQS